MSADKKEYKTLTELFIDYKLNHIIDFAISPSKLIEFADNVCGDNIFKREEYSQIILYILHNSNKYQHSEYNLPDKFGKYGPKLLDIIPKSIIESISNYIATIYGSEHYEKILNQMPVYQMNNTIEKCLSNRDINFIVKFIEFIMAKWNVSNFYMGNIRLICNVINYNVLLRCIQKNSSNYNYSWYLNTLLKILNTNSVRSKKTIIRYLIMLLTRTSDPIGGENVTIIIKKLLEADCFDLVLYFRRRYYYPIDKRILLELPKFHSQYYQKVFAFIDNNIDKEIFDKFVETFDDIWNSVKIFKIFDFLLFKDLTMPVGNSDVLYLKLLNDSHSKCIKLQNLLYNIDQNNILYILHRKDKIKISELIDQIYILIYKMILKTLSIFIGSDMTRSILYYM